MSNIFLLILKRLHLAFTDTSFQSRWTLLSYIKKGTFSISYWEKLYKMYWKNVRSVVLSTVHVTVWRLFGNHYEQIWMQFFFVFFFFCGPHCRRRIITSPVAVLHPSLFCAAGLQFISPILLMLFSTSSLYLALGHLLDHFLCELAWYIFFVFFTSFVVSVPSIWGVGVLLKVPAFMSLYNSSGSTFICILHWLSSIACTFSLIYSFRRSLVFLCLTYFLPMFLHCRLPPEL